MAIPDGVAVEGGPDEKPRVTLPGGDPPGDLVIHDVVEGDGAAVPPGGTVNAHYVGIGWSSGRQFDASWDRGAPLSFPLDRVIAGWQEGIPGMKPGGRRLLVIPGDRAYGPTPPPGSGIGANETLVFVVDLVG
ncbi:MAG TPA: FKBP-type peptidyl-prolyl cis-trans isomerase [Miltoncostaeaceae bacterium]|jgi:peptidylprolyl isomerase|nr:FKBP-type peptidyl-prolyl cis-trans isomerase [Miltoncostaeaceae bacterium]